MHGERRVVAKYYAAGLLLLFAALFIFVSGRSSSLAFQAVAVSPPVNESALSNHPTSSSQLIFWLQSRGLTPSHSLFLSIADASYIAALRNFRQRLDQWGYGENLVVICLDEDCRACDTFHGYPGLIGRSIAYIKVRIAPLISLLLIVVVCCKPGTCSARLQLCRLRWGRVFDWRVRPFFEYASSFK